MATIYTTIRVKKDTIRVLKVLAATTGESMLSMMHRLVQEERNRLRVVAPPVPSPTEQEGPHVTQRENPRIVPET
jgi:hypothetical protein